MDERTQARVREINRRTALRRRRADRRAMGISGSLCALMLLGIATLLGGVQAAGGVAGTAGASASLLLQEGAGPYVVVGVAAFVAGVAVALICFRVRNLPRAELRSEGLPRGQMPQVPQQPSDTNTERTPSRESGEQQ